MNTIFRNNVIWLSVILIVALATIAFFSEVLFPFIFAMVLAYLLDPIVDRLEAFGLNRLSASILVMALAMGIIFVSAIVVLPTLIEQTQSIILLTPDFVDVVLVRLANLLPPHFDKELLINNGLSALTQSAQKYGADLASQLALYAVALVDLVVLFLIVPIITFYLLMDWNKIVSKVSKYLPSDRSDDIHLIILEIDETLSGFIRGQLLVCFILGLFYSVTLFWLELNYCFLIGVFAGILSFIPFLGAILGATVALAVALFQFWGAPDQIVLVAVFFIVGQVIEGNFLTPKLVGGAVKLHPVFLMLAVSVGGAVAGLSGVLLSVPLAAIFGVLIRYFLKQYLETDGFTGES